MKTIIGVRFAEVGKVYYFDPGGLELQSGDHVIVETARGVEYGEVALGPKNVEKFNKQLKKVIRKADEKDSKTLEKNKQKEKDAFVTGEDKILKRNLPMKLIDVEYTFDGGKIIFYFTAEGRVDFRELVKDLAAVFKTRIELRQIGVRDEAKKIGGLGPCGRPACCAAFMGDFQPVSIKMAKEQNLSLSPTKISGLCGRLMCCLNYEHEYYHDMRKKLPRNGVKVKTPDGEAEVADTNALTQKVKVRAELPDGSYEMRTYLLSEIKIPGKKAVAAAEEVAIEIDDEIKSILDE
ncbi:MAG TPA: stage 0 sporulation protein [Clostridiales bacterium]|nr:stage 0 sporulation protein [Clostridiales bacterium]